MYDLIIRDATIVSALGREVADVAIKNGKLAYVGPRPPRKARREISAIGKFLMPGVIDTAVCFGDTPSQWEVESRAAASGGITSVLVTPAGASPVINAKTAKARLEALAGHSWVNFGLWGNAIEGNAADLAEAAEKALIVGCLADFTGRPGGLPPAMLESFVGNAGVLGVTSRAEGPLEGSPEAVAVMNAVQEHQRAVHWMHLSTAAELDLLDPVRGDLPVTSGVTPHHLFLSQEEDPGTTTVPPVRPEKDRRTLWTAVRRGRLDCIASDHHPKGSASAGIPGSELLFPLMLSAVKYGRLSLEMLVSLCAESPARIFGLENKGRIAKGADADLILFTEGEIVRIEKDMLLSESGPSPYVNREAAPKPDLVIVNGQVVAVRGEHVGEKPGGLALSQG